MNKKSTKLLALGLCGIIGISNVGCSSIGKKEAKKNTEASLEDANIKDIRTVKVNQDQAMLRFTTQNKAGSISSLVLGQKDKNYIYTIDGIDKKGQNIIMKVDAKTSKVISNEIVGPASPEKKADVLNFAIIKDTKSALKAAFKKVDMDVYNQVDSYKLMYTNKKNTYKFIFSNGETEKEKIKVKTVLVNAENLKVIEEEKK